MCIDNLNIVREIFRVSIIHYHNDHVICPFFLSRKEFRLLLNYRLVYSIVFLTLAVISQASSLRSDSCRDTSSIRNKLKLKHIGFFKL